MAKQDIEMELETAIEVQKPVVKMPVEVRLQNLLQLLENAVKNKDTKLLVGRFLRQIAAVRGHLNADLLYSLADSIFTTELPGMYNLLSLLYKKKGPVVEHVSYTFSLSSTHALPEVEAFLYLLVIMFLLDNKYPDEAAEVSRAAIERMMTFNQRTLDGLTSKLYFYYSWSHERINKLADIRTQLLALHKSAVLRHDIYGQEILLNLLLRNYLHYNLYEQAESFRSKAPKNDTWRSHSQLCRYLYYIGKIRAIQLDYREAKEFLQQSARKAPVVACGFRILVNKWLIVVRLLLGDTPEHLEFQQLGLQKSLSPYFHLTQAIRIGDLSAFSKVAEAYDNVFRQDGTLNLITRLRHNVIRTGLRRINTAYSKISLSDIARKLSLQNAEDAESILAKAIRDGGVDAIIDHENSWMVSKQMVDVYTTIEPQSAFHDRVTFCLDIHNEAVKAMQFESDLGKLDSHYAAEIS